MRSSRLLVAVVCLSPLGQNAQVVPLRDFASCAAIDDDRARMVAEFSPYRARPITANFDLTGLSNAIAPLRETYNR